MECRPMIGRPMECLACDWLTDGMLSCDWSSVGMSVYDWSSNGMLACDWSSDGMATVDWTTDGMSTNQTRITTSVAGSGIYGGMVAGKATFLSIIWISAIHWSHELTFSWPSLISAYPHLLRWQKRKNTIILPNENAFSSFVISMKNYPTSKKTKNHLTV